VHQLQLTVTDFVVEIHDTHHPIGVSLYYEDQRAPAKKRAGEFWKDRVPKYLGYFERLLNSNGGSYLTGRRVTTRSLVVPDRRGAALRFSETHEGVRARDSRPGRFARSRRREAQHQGLSRKRPAHRLQRGRHLPRYKRWMFRFVIPRCAIAPLGMRHLAQARNPYSRSWLWIPGSLVSLAPGMTANSTDSFRRSASSQVLQARYRRCS